MVNSRVWLAVVVGVLVSWPWGLPRGYAMPSVGESSLQVDGVEYMFGEQIEVIGERAEPLDSDRVAFGAIMEIEANRFNGRASQAGVMGGFDSCCYVPLGVGRGGKRF